MSGLMSKVTMAYTKMRGQLKFMTLKTKKVILESKLKGQVNLTMPLLINQSQCVKKRAKVIIMRINKWIRGGPYYKVSSEKICNEIGNMLPERELLNTNAKFIHKQITFHQNEALREFIAIPNRSTSKLYHKAPYSKLC